MAPLNLRSAVEALLFSSDQPLTLVMIADALEAAPEPVTEALRSLADEYHARDAGIEVREMAGGWIVTTTAAQHEWVGRMLRGKRRMRLSRAALETLAIIAYKQPVTKSEIEAIRGVDSSGTLATLLERSLVTIKGRSTVVGRPLLYGSTPEFLNYFGWKELSELPRPEELRALVAAREPEQLEMLELDGDGMPLALVAAGAEVLAAAEDGAGEPAIAAPAGAYARGAAGSEADDATAASAFLVSGDTLAASDEPASDEARDEARDEAEDEDGDEAEDEDEERDEDDDDDADDADDDEDEE